MPGRRTHSARLVCGLALAASALALAACGDSGGQSGGAGAEAASVRSEQSNVQSSNQDSSTQSSSQGGTQSATRSGNGSVSQSSISTEEGPIRLYGGTSDATLTLDVDKASRLLWSNDRGRRFRLTGAGADVDSTAGSGEVALSAGQHRLAVHGTVWTVVIRPG
ncbi:MAG: hypothetical protein QOH38_1765 [Thermoleophilaceae bacterium]|nr:hypothetical protein [Thermoleophilaceae bacterium]